MTLQISEEAKKRLEELKGKYPDPRSAVMPALYIVQEELGSINDEAISWVSEAVDIPPVHVKELATFYTMYYQKPVGKYHIQVCRTLSCAICGSKKLSEKIHERLGIAPGEVSEDGMWSFEQVECLGSCGSAPMCEINDVYFENLSPEKLDELMDVIESQKPDLRYSTIRGELGDGIKGRTKSEVLPGKEIVTVD